MKKIAIMLSVVLFASLLISCGPKKKTGEKMGEKIAGKVIEKATGGDTEVNVDGEEITFKNKEGEAVTFGSTKWPNIDYIPEFKKGKITNATSDSKGNIMVVFEKVDQKDFENYWKSLEEDFSEETSEMQIDEYILYSGKNAKGETVAVQYFKKDSSLSIIGNRPE
jgi:hypothetical protein